MKTKIKQREFKIWIVLTLTILALWISFIFIIVNNRQNNEQAFSDEKLKQLESNVNSTLATYEVFSNYIFSEIIEDNEVNEIMYKANFATDEEKTLLRNNLNDKLENTYIKMKDYNYRQFHFHLPNTESFLRLHRPDKYGDLLKDVRESVRIANAEKIFVSGFEEGRIFNGFRHVYPITYNDTHVGSVEISVSTASIIEVLTSHYKNDDFYFIMDKLAVEGKVFDNEMTNYNNSTYFKDFFVDTEVENFTSKYNKIVPKESDLFFNGINNKYRDQIENNESFSINYNFDKTDYIINFLAIENFKNEPIAYLISVTEGIGFEIFSAHMYLELALVSTLVLLIIVFTYIFSNYQSKIRSASEIDYLTKLYNRKKFYEVAKIELLSLKRYKYESSLLLFDIDHFKDINDNYGHEYGDQVLATLSNEILVNIRKTDVFARWGGEEFVLLLPHTNLTNASKVAEKLRYLIENSNKPELKDVTISIGVTNIDPKHESIDDSIKLADKAMYCAKNKGRNQVFVNNS